MSTLDQEAPATIAAVTENTDPGEKLEVLDCAQCGRNCRHTPKLALGGGTAGSDKGMKFTPTARSESRCPACDGKPHRKEGRIYTEISCQYRQAMKALGSTEMLHPTEAIYLKMAEMSRTDAFRKVPTEREIENIVREKMGLPAIEPKRRVKNSSEPVPQDKTKAEVDLGNAEKIEGVNLSDISLPVKVETTPESKLMAESGTAEGVSQPKKSRKKKASKADEADTQAETEAAAPIQPDEVEVEAGALDGDDDYNPFAGIGQPMEDDEEEELTDAQKAALGVA